MSEHSPQQPLLPDHQLFAVLGEEGFARIVYLFYEKVKQDDILGPMYRASPEAAHAPDMETHMHDAEVRLRDFLVGRFGGPQRYVQMRGHPRLRMRHMPFRIDVNARNRWVELISESINEAQLDENASASLRTIWHRLQRF